MKGRTAKVLVEHPALRFRRLFVPVRLVLRSIRLLIIDTQVSSKLLGKGTGIFVDVCHLAV